MNKKIFWAGFAVLFICISIILSGYMIGDAIKSNNATSTKNTYEDLKVFNLTQVAEYLHMTEQEVKSIIVIENNKLTNTGTFFGEMFPYFKVNDNFYFYKDALDIWLIDATKNRRGYDTEKYIQVQ
jgi:hypothetical protein